MNYNASILNTTTNDTTVIVSTDYGTIISAIASASRKAAVLKHAIQYHVTLGTKKVNPSRLADDVITELEFSRVRLYNFPALTSEEVEAMMF